MPQTLGDGAILLDAFPFDSSPELVTDINGYLKGDRSVDAWTMRYAFRQFFSNGVFGTPGDSFIISKAPTGLAVSVKPGCCVINGGMGGVLSETTLPLGIEQAAGNTCYGIFLRYDDASYRGIALVAREGTAGAAPKPPEPYDNGESVTELRLGYVMLPNGATDLSNATVTNEKGLAVCPYAAPFEEIDTDAVVADAKASAEESLSVFSEMLATYYDLVQSSVDGTTAGNLQNQIDELKVAGLSEGSVDGVTIAYEPTTTSGGVDKLQVKDGGIGSEQIADYAVAKNKLSAELQIELDIMDTTGWGFDDYLEFTEQLSEDLITDFVATIESSVFDGWQASQLIQYMGVIPDAAQKDITGRMSMADRTWPELSQIAAAISQVGRSGFVGRDKSVSLTTFGTRSFRCVGVDHYTSTGGDAHLVFFATKGIGSTKYDSTMLPPPAAWDEMEIGIYVQDTVAPKFPSELSSVMKECDIPSICGPDNLDTKIVKAKLWPVSSTELGKNLSTATEGSVLEYFAGSNSITTGACWTRSREGAYGANAIAFGQTTASLSKVNAAQSKAASAVFCI